MSDAGSPATFSVATMAVAAGRPPRRPDGPTNPPIVLASTYHAGGEVGYGRYGNPTWEMLESAVGALEGGVATSFASGLAAVDAVLDLVPAGGTVVTSPAAYHGTLALLSRLQDSGRLTARLVDLGDPGAADRAMAGADLCWVESPTNPLLRTVDIAGLAARAHSAGALLAVDSTFATPVLQRPLEHGADLVLHSATKYLGGHSDVIGGLVVTRSDELAERLRFHQNAAGAVPSPFDCFLVMRGLRTLAVRMDRASTNAATLAGWLAERPEVSAVHYPGLPGHPAAALVERQMRLPGAMLSFELHGGEDRARSLAGATRLFTLAESLGAVESLIEVPAPMTHASVADSPLAVPPSLVRLSVGIEALDDLRADLEAAFASAAS